MPTVSNCLAPELIEGGGVEGCGFAVRGLGTQMGLSNDVI